MAQFYSILTNYGVTAFAKAMSSKQPLNILKMAVGDGNGQVATPNASQTALVREVYRANISAIKLDIRNNKQVIFELTIPDDVGGFYIREIGIFDNNEKLVAVANTPESYKPQLTEGSGKVQVLRMILLVSSSDSVNLTVDNSLIWATRAELTPKDLDENSRSIIEENGHSHQLPLATLLKKGITKLFSGLDSDAEDMAATPKAIKALKSLIDAITRNLGNYIPNSKKSNAINSNSADTVATSLAVKTAYDLADAAYKVDTSNQNQNLNSLLGQNTVFGIAGRAAGTTGLGDIYSYGVGLAISAAGARAMLYIPHSHARGNKGVWVQSSFSTNNAPPHWMRIDGADFGDIRGNPFTVAGYTVRSSTAYLSVHATNSAFGGFEVDRSGTNGNWQSRFEALPDRRWKFWTNSDGRGFEQFLPAKNGTIALMDDVNARVSKSGDTMTGLLNIKDGDYSSVRTYNNAGFAVRWESAPQSDNNFAAIVYAHSNTSVINKITIPKKSGTMALIEDFGYQKIGNFEVRKYPDGTMIQTCLHRNGGLNYNRNPNDNSDLVTLVYPSAFVDMPVVNITQHLSHPYFDDSRGGLTTNDKSKRLGSHLGEANDGAIGLTIDNSRTQCQFTYSNNAVFISEVTFHILAIGRWK